MKKVFSDIHFQEMAVLDCAPVHHIPNVKQDLALLQVQEIENLINQNQTVNKRKMNN